MDVPAACPRRVLMPHSFAEGLSDATTFSKYCVDHVLRVVLGIHGNVDSQLQHH